MSTRGESFDILDSAVLKWKAEAGKTEFLTLANGPISSLRSEKSSFEIVSAVTVPWRGRTALSTRDSTQDGEDRLVEEGEFLLLAADVFIICTAIRPDGSFFVVATRRLSEEVCAIAASDFDVKMKDAGSSASTNASPQYEALLSSSRETPVSLAAAAGFSKGNVQIFSLPEFDEVAVLDACGGG